MMVPRSTCSIRRPSAWRPNRAWRTAFGTASIRQRKRSTRPITSVLIRASFTASTTQYASCTTGCIRRRRRWTVIPITPGYLRNQPTRFYLGWRARPGLPVFAGLTLHRRGRLGPASEAEVALLAAVEPHLQRALLAEWRLHRAGHPAILAATDDQQVGMVLLAADGRVLHANAAAGAIAARADALALGRTLEALRPGDRERLAALLADTLAPVVPPRAPAVLRLMRRWGGPDYVVSAMPLGRGADLFPPWRPAACVTILDPAATAPNSAAMLREAFGLTPAEARLVARLADGDTLAGAAGHSGWRCRPSGPTSRPPSERRARGDRPNWSG